MRVVCPSCATEYEVPLSRLTSRRAVRCARCAGEWIPEHEVAEAAQPAGPSAPPADPHVEVEAAAPAPEAAPALPTLTAMDRLAASAPPRLPHPSLLAAWIMTIVVLVGAATAAVWWRGDVMWIWPPASRVLGSSGHMPPVQR